MGPDPRELIEYLQKFPGELHVTLEACPVWQPYYDAAVQVGADVKLAHPAGVRWIAKAKKKNDRVDSEKLATLLRTGDIPEAYAPTPEERELRRVVSDWFFFNRKSVAVMNHTYGILLQKGVRYPEGILTLKRRRENLRQLQIRDVDRGLDTLKALDPVLKGLEKTIEEAYQRSPEAQLLTSIPGVGKKVAVTLTAYLCPVSRFNNLDEIAAYSGLCPRTSQSSKRAWIGSLRQDSNHLLSAMLNQAVLGTPSPKQGQRHQPGREEEGEEERPSGRRNCRVAQAPRYCLCHPAQRNPLRVSCSRATELQKPSG